MGLDDVGGNSWDGIGSDGIGVAGKIGDLLGKNGIFCSGLEFGEFYGLYAEKLFTQNYSMLTLPPERCLTSESGMSSEVDSLQLEMQSRTLMNILTRNRMIIQKQKTKSPTDTLGKMYLYHKFRLWVLVVPGILGSGAKDWICQISACKWAVLLLISEELNSMFNGFSRRLNS